MHIGEGGRWLVHAMHIGVGGTGHAHWTGWLVLGILRREGSRVGSDGHANWSGWQVGSMGHAH